MICPECGQTVVAQERISLDVDTRILQIGTSYFSLSETEVKLMKGLVVSFGNVVSRVSLMNSIYGGLTGTPSPNVIGLYLSRIRKKIQHTKLRIRTIRGRGVVLEMKE